MTAQPNAPDHGPSLQRMAELARLGTEAAIKAGAQQADTCGSYWRSISASLRDKGVREVKLSVGGGVGIRAFVNGGMGYAYTMLLDEDSVRDVGARAARLARAAQPDPHFVSLPAPPATPVPEVPGLFDERLVGFQVPDVVRRAEALAALVLKEAPEAILGYGGLGVTGPSRWVLHNSLGVEVQRESTALGGSVMVLLKPSPDDTGSGWEYDGGRRLEDFVPEQVAQEAVRKARAMLGAQAVQTRRCTVVLSPNATRSLGYALSGLLNGWSVVYDRTCLAGTLGQRLAPPHLTVWSDPLVAGGNSSGAVDGEGTPRQRFPILDKGVVATYLHNAYTAQRLGQPNNACYQRGYDGPGGVGPANLQFEPGERRAEQLIREVDDGVFIDSFPAPDAATGNMSSMVDYGIEIRGGELGRGLKGTMIGSTFKEFLANVDAVSSDARREPGEIFPALRVRDVQIAGR
ncbi:MAG TPA: TldD/PmbA family protein [Chloroflexota bacterium]|nr:TldD/PmbA family protein [Chloroflexota bacterium]